MNIVKDIEQATHTITCELYIVDVDDTGLYLLNALRAKSRQGVRVQLLVDAVGSYPLYLASTLKNELRKDGIELSFFNHFIPWHPRSINLWYFRNHRRSIIIDGRIAYTGGICFSKSMAGWKDTMIRITNEPAITDMCEAFTRMWKLSEHKHFEKRRRPMIKEWLYLTNAPVPGRFYYYNAVLKLIKNAQHNIYLTTPYFVPNHQYFVALLKAQRRGVRVHLLIPKDANHPFVGHAGDWYKGRLIKAGAHIYQYTQSMIHTKTAVFDDTSCMIGSLNLDNVSLRYNFEGGLIIRNPQCIADLTHHFKEDTQGLSPLTYTQWCNRPLKDKVVGFFSWWIRKLL